MFVDPNRLFGSNVPGGSLARRHKLWQCHRRLQDTFLIQRITDSSTARPPNQAGLYRNNASQIKVFRLTVLADISGEMMPGR